MSAYRRPYYADDVAIAAELRKHHVVLERRDEQQGTSTITCSCGETFGPLPSGEGVLTEWVGHFLAKLNPA